MSGKSEEKIRTLEADFHTADLPADQKAGLAFARKLARCNPRPDAANLQGLRAAGMSDAMVTELTTVVASTLVASRSMIMCAEPPAAQFEKMAFSPLAKVLGFVMVMRNTAKRMTKEPGRLPDGAVDGPFGKQLARIDGMPKAPHFHQAVTGMLVSNVLPKRTKLLVLAVVARTAQCPGGEIECRRLLEQEGATKRRCTPSSTRWAAATRRRWRPHFCRWRMTRCGRNLRWCKRKFWRCGRTWTSPPSSSSSARRASAMPSAASAASTSIRSRSRCSSPLPPSPS
jgi:hypothetical protein